MILYLSIYLVAKIEIYAIIQFYFRILNTYLKRGNNGAQNTEQKFRVKKWSGNGAFNLKYSYRAKVHSYLLRTIVMRNTQQLLRETFNFDYSYKIQHNMYFLSSGNCNTSRGYSLLYDLQYTTCNKFATANYEKIVFQYIN